MPRRPRLIEPGIPLHITQRGVDRCPTFLGDEDFAYYRWALCEASVEARCDVHAYALMTNHVHLLLTPHDPMGPQRLMIFLGRRFVRYFNDRYRRTGTLWEGRFRSAVVDSESYLLRCSRYIEMNPVEAGMVANPAAYPWSSYRGNALGHDDPIITPHPLYTAMGPDGNSRCKAYRALFATPLEPDAVATIRAAQRGRAKLHPTTYEQVVAELRDRETVAHQGAGTCGEPRRLLQEQPASAAAAEITTTTDVPRASR